MRSKIEYYIDKAAFDYITKKYNTTIRSRNAEITIYGKTEKEVNELFNSLEKYIKENSNYYFTSCPDIYEEKEGLWYYFDSIGVNDKEEYNEIKELYKEWKKLNNRR